MTPTQEHQLILILSDFVPVLDGDIVQAINPEAHRLTRQIVLAKLEEEDDFLLQEPSLSDWVEENKRVLQEVSDEEFQEVLRETILITEFQIGHSLFDPLTDGQRGQLAETILQNKIKNEEASSKKSVGFFSKATQFLRGNR
ncbi:hypothetical protein [Streptococcus suis]|uniref:hypothetical protein n=1 Tax=Streptococcus suis TaxID=1307 RepID=UPI000CF5FD87|nr:hypothetical protein [Streptococcus suis]